MLKPYMKRLLDHVYARQRLVSFHRLELRQRAETVRGIGWAVFFLLVLAALLLLGLSQ